jgi:hypothetical protein
MKNIHISEEDFVEAIEALKKQLEHDEFFGESMENAFPGSHAPIYDNHYLWEALIKLLEIAASDTSKTVEWWIYETKFGAEPDKRIIETRDGKEIVITLPTAKDLYNYLKNK